MYYVNLTYTDGHTHRANSVLIGAPKHDGKGNFRNRKDARAYAAYYKSLRPEITVRVATDRPVKKRTITPKKYRVLMRKPDANELFNRVWQVCATFDKRAQARDYVQKQHEFDREVDVTGWQYKITEVKLAQGQV